MKKIEFINNSIGGLQELFTYGVVGLSVTLLNMLFYYLLTRYFPIHYMVASALAFVLANIYAFFANKVWVFHSNNFALRFVLPEAAGFLSARALSCLIDLGIMYIGVDIMDIADMMVKIVSSVVIIALNYLLSKFIIFRKKGDSSK